MDDLQGMCNEFKITFEGAVDQLGAALIILQELEALKRQKYARSTSQGFFGALNAAQAGPSPWAGVRQGDARLIRLLEAWRGNTTERPERYTPPDVFARPPEPVEPEKIEKTSPGLTERVLDRFFRRPG